MSPLREISFTEAFSNKIQEIRDVVAGRRKVKELNVDTDEDTNENYEKKMEKLFESLQKKILHLNLSEEGESPAKIPVERTKERKDVVTTTSSEGKQWYDGTSYTCDQCGKTIYGGLAFKKHLKDEHNLQSKDLKNFVEFSSKHEELSYACLACKETVNHQFHSIYDHLRRKHSLSIGEYESQFLKKPQKAVSTGINRTPVVNLLRMKSSELEKYLVILPPGFRNARKSRTLSSSSGDEEINKNISTKQTEDKSKSFQGKPPRIENLKKRKRPADIKEVREPVKLVEKEKELDKEILVVYEAPVKKRYKTLYYCPVSDSGCTFFTMREGFKDSTAAGHLSQVHGIRKQAMKPGKYKFRIVKSEIL